MIVESPTKAKTLERFLGDGYNVMASKGHVRDLPSGKIGVEVQDGFKPQYAILSEKKSILSGLKKLAKKANRTYLATDPDREGEAISWHLIEAIGLKPESVHRVVFHEITKEAVDHAFKEPRSINMDLVNAQQARRILDRLIGYELSPLLWNKLRWPKYKLSAGRVQSAALRIVVERSREIDRFVSKEYWTIKANLVKNVKGNNAEFTSKLHSIDGSTIKQGVADETTSKGIVSDLKSSIYTVAEVSKKASNSKPAAPFITSTLQQEASRKLGFSAKRTMSIAQQLYEGVEMGSEGQMGLITYMRTDSTHIAPSAIGEVRDFILKQYKEKYLPKSPRFYKKKAKGAQEAHEAIRPTSAYRMPDNIKGYLDRQQFLLYELIWKRFVASQMTDAIAEGIAVDLEAIGKTSKKKYIFRATYTKLKFKGFRQLYIEGTDDGSAQDDSLLPNLETGETVSLKALDPQQHFTQPPPKFTEASLIKSLEDKGIGRPSTYATIVSIIQEKNYVRRDSGRFIPEPLGIVITELLEDHFSDIVDLNFTAKMETDLDQIADGQLEWKPILGNFYFPFNEAINKASENIEHVTIPSGESCEKCESPMIIKSGRFGQFLACSAYPECKNTKNIVVTTGANCPECKGEIVERRGKKAGRLFYGCLNYPDCNFSTLKKPLPEPCPKCNGLLTSYRGSAQCTSCEFKGAVPTEEVLST